MLNFGSLHFADSLVPFYAYFSMCGSPDPNLSIPRATLSFGFRLISLSEGIYKTGIDEAEVAKTQ